MPKASNSYFYSRPNYPNVYMDERGTWYARKWSQVREKELHRKIKGCAGKSDAAKAYRLGAQMFTAFEGRQLEEKGSAVTMADLVRSRRIRRKKEREANEITQSTLVNSLTVLDAIEKAWGHLRPEQVTADTFKDHYLSAYSKTRAEMAGRPEAEIVQAYPRFANTLKELRLLMKKAYSLSLIREVPKFKNPDPDSTRRIYLTPERAWSIINAECEVSENIRRLARWVYLTGIRPFEAVALERDWFNWKAGTVTVRRPKPKTPVREIPVPQSLLEDAREHFRRSGSRFLFPGADDQQWSDKAYLRPWRTLCAAAGISTDIYSLRHSFASDMVDAGEPETKLAKYMGTSVAMLDRVYYKNRPAKLETISERQGQRIIRGSFEEVPASVKKAEGAKHA